MSASRRGNTQQNMKKAEGRTFRRCAGKIVKAGVVRLMELQEKGWARGSSTTWHHDLCASVRAASADPRTVLGLSTLLVISASAALRHNRSTCARKHAISPSA
jgi:hypothetical protein